MSNEYTTESLIEDRRWLRHSESGRPKVLGALGLGLSMAALLKFGVSGFWSRNDNREMLKEGAALVGAGSAIGLSLSYMFPNSTRSLIERAKDARGWLIGGAAVGALAYGGLVATDNGDKNPEPLTANTEVTTPNTKTNTTSSAAPVASTTFEGDGTPFVYNQGNPLPPGECTVPAPIVGKSDKVVTGVKHFKEILQAAGYDPGDVNSGNADNNLSLAVNHVQVDFGMSQAEAEAPTSRWKLEDCYEAAHNPNKPALSVLWVDKA